MNLEYLLITLFDEIDVHFEPQTLNPEQSICVVWRFTIISGFTVLF
jgi:hypothetical protein